MTKIQFAAKCQMANIRGPLTTYQSQKKEGEKC